MEKKTHAIYVQGPDGSISVMATGTQEYLEKVLKENLPRWQNAVNAGFKFYVDEFSQYRPDGIFVSVDPTWTHDIIGNPISTGLKIVFDNYVKDLNELHKIGVNLYKEFIRVFQMKPGPEQKRAEYKVGPQTCLPPETKNVRTQTTNLTTGIRTWYLTAPIILPDGKIVKEEIQEEDV